MGEILAFPEDDFRAPVSIRLRDWARTEIDSLRRRRARGVPSPEPTDAAQGQQSPPRADSCAVSGQPLTPFKPDCATGSVREREVDSALMDEIRQARSLLIDETEPQLEREGRA